MDAPVSVCLSRGKAESPPWDRKGACKRACKCPSDVCACACMGDAKCHTRRWYLPPIILNNPKFSAYRGDDKNVEPICTEYMEQKSKNNARFRGKSIGMSQNCANRTSGIMIIGRDDRIIYI